MTIVNLVKILYDADLEIKYIIVSHDIIAWLEKYGNHQPSQYFKTFYQHK